MFERFTDRGRKVMALANQEAQRFSHEYIGTEHVLLGIEREGAGVCANVLKNLNIDLRKVRLEVEKKIKSGPEMVTMGKLPHTPTTKKVIDRAIEYARTLNHNYVGTEHLGAALLTEEGSIAGDVLTSLGVNRHAYLAEVKNLLGATESEESELEVVREPNVSENSVDLLLETDKGTARERLEELCSAEYRKKHGVQLVSLSGYNILPEIDMDGNEGDFARIFDDGFEMMTDDGIGHLFDEGKKYRLEFKVDNGEK